MYIYIYIYIYIYKFLAHACYHVYMKDSFSFFSYPEIPRIYRIKEPINNMRRTYPAKNMLKFVWKSFFIKKKQEKQE